MGVSGTEFAVIIMGKMVNMNGTHHKNHMTATKRAIALLMGLILFTSQLSYKFYLLSSRPVFDHITQKPSPSSAGKGILHTYDHKAALSLDKRYNFQKVFALWTPVFQPGFFSTPNKRKIPGPDQGLPASLLTIHAALRGPPQV
jgi:hypothetical protein